MRRFRRRRAGRKFYSSFYSFLRNTRKMDSLPAANMRVSLAYLGPPAAAFARLRNTRKTDSLPTASLRVSLACLGPPAAAFALTAMDCLPSFM